MKIRRLSPLILVGDVIWIVCAFFIATLFRYGTIVHMRARFPDNFILFSFIPVCGWVLLSAWMRLDCFEGGWRFSAAVSRLILAEACMLSLLLASGYLLRQYISRLVLAYFSLLLVAGFLCLRYLVRGFLRARYRSGKVRKTIIVGNDRIGKEIALKIERHPEMMCQVIGFLHPDEGGAGVPPGGDALQSANCELTSLAVLSLMERESVSELILALPVSARPEILNLAAACRQRGISVSLVPQPYELYLSKPNLMDLDGLPLLQLQEVANSTADRSRKRVFDVLVTCVLCLPALALTLPAALFLWLRKGKAFRWEKRSGQNAVPFRLLRLNVDRHGLARLPFVERVLTEFSITELPQLWNVLRGDMSLVGPRPEGYERVRHYTEWQQQRLCVKPGLTGLAQVHGLRDQHSSEEKTRFDLQYQLNPSLVNDFSLLLQTLCTLVCRMLQPSQFAPQISFPTVVLSSQPESDSFKEVLPIAYRSQSSAD